MRILQVNDYGYQIGGAENYFFSISAALQSAGHQVLTVTSDRNRKGKKLLSTLQIKESGNCFNLDIFFNPLNYFEFSSVLKNFRPEVIHFHNIFYALSPSVIFASKNYQTVLTLHDYAAICHGDKRLSDGSLCQQSLNNCQHCKQRGSYISKLKKEVGLYALKKVDQLIAPSKFMQAQFELNGFNNISYLPHPLTYSTSLSEHIKITPNLRKDFLYIGRLAEQKGVSLLLKAFKQLNTDALLHIAGSGPEENKLRAECSKLEISDRVIFHGWIDAGAREELLRKAFVVVIPSLWPEVAPLVVGEASSYLVPVIAADIGGLSEMIKHEETGLLFKAGDLSKLTEAINFANTNREILLSYGKAASDYAKTQTIDKHLARLLELYRL